MKLVIFDLDGVIVSTDKYHFEAWSEVCIEKGYHFDYEMNHLLRGVSRAESLKIILKQNKKRLGEKNFNKMLEQKNEIYRNNLYKLTVNDILPGVSELLNSLKVHKISVAVGSSSRNTPLILEQIGLSDWFETVVDGNTISKSKPDPEVFVKCAENLKIACKDCIVIEDAKAGIEAAKAGNMVAVGVGEQDFEDADMMLESLEGTSYQTMMDIYKIVRG